MTFVNAQIPQILLNQTISDWDIHQYQNETRIMINPNNNIVCPSATTKLADWKLSSKEEVQLISESFVKSSETKLGFSFNDLKFVEIIFSNQTDYDYFNPSATIIYKQYYREIPVFESSLNIGINAYGTIWSVKERNVIKNITISTNPIILSNDTIEIVKNYYTQSNLQLEKAPELYIYSGKLVWRLNILEPIFKEMIIDSQNGEIVLERENYRETENPTITKKCVNEGYICGGIAGLMCCDELVCNVKNEGMPDAAGVCINQKNISYSNSKNIIYYFIGVGIITLLGYILFKKRVR
jgi:Zn-dependent metalloprotease